MARSTYPLTVSPLLFAAARILLASFVEHRRSTVVLAPGVRFELLRRNMSGRAQRARAVSSNSTALMRMFRM